MTIQASLNSASMSYIPKIKAVINLSLSKFSSNQMIHEALQAMCNTSKQVDSMTFNELETFQNELIESFKQKGRLTHSVHAKHKIYNVMREYALTLEPSTDRAQCFCIANLELKKGDSIADMLSSDHRKTCDGALRAARLLEDAGLAIEIKNKNPKHWGTFIFADGSEIE
jgi:hypothetical protein